MSDTAPLTFAQKILSLYERVAYMKKGGNNAHFNYKFLQEAAVKERVSAACRELGLYLDDVEATPLGEITGKAAVIKVTISLANADNLDEYVLLQGIGAGSDSSDKAPMKAMAAATKYAFMTGLLIATGDDPEADATTDQDAFEDMRERLHAAVEAGNVLGLKAEIAAFRDHPKFKELVTAFNGATKKKER